MLYALLPRWVERRGIFQPCGLLRGRCGRAFDGGARVEDHLEPLCDPAECGVASVVECEGTKSHEKLLDELVDAFVVEPALPFSSSRPNLGLYELC